MPELLTVEEADAQELFYERGWTDGLPVIPPTPARVAAMLEAGGVDGADTLGVLTSSGRVVRAEEVAICAVMAGAPANCFPIIITAVEAVFDTAFNAPAVFSSTGGAGIAVVVSGPMAQEVGMNSGHSVLGPGNRPNATIGRTLRLLGMVVLGFRPGRMDASSIGHPGKYTLCFAEDGPPAAWSSLRSSLGFDEADTTVTVMGVSGPSQIGNLLNGDGHGVLRTIAAMISNPANFIVGKGGQGIVVLGPEHTLAMLEAGIDREQACRTLAAATRVSPTTLEDAGVLIEVGTQHDMTPGPDGLLPTLRDPEDLLIVTGGGGGAGWSAWMPAFAPRIHSRYVTRRVRPADEPLPDCGPDSCEVKLPPPTKE